MGPPAAVRGHLHISSDRGVRAPPPCGGLVGLTSGGEDEAAVLPVAQRFVSAEDAPGSKPDPVEQGQTTADFDDFTLALSDALIDPDTEEMTMLFQEAGFKQAGLDVRFFGESHSPQSPHVFSWFIELGSEDGAKSTLDWLEADGKKPCPMSCAAKISSFDLDGIADARGLHRVATAEDIERVGTEDQIPFDSYWIGFKNGGIVYAVDLHGPPGSVSEEQAQQIASAYYARLAGG